MALKSSNKIETNVYELEVSVDGQAWADAKDKAYNKLKKEVNIPGFRKGKAPKAVILKFFGGEEVLYNDAIDAVFPDAVDAAIKEAGLEIVDSPFDGDVKEINADSVTFTFKVTVKPEIELGKYKGLKVAKESVAVSAADVNAELNNMLERSARFVEVDRKVKKGDMTTIDFSGSVDGVKFDGGEAEDYELEIGSGSFIPGFEDQIIGHKVGDEFDINVKFPEEYAEELAGKDAVFAIKLRSVKEKELPALDDEFAKDVSEYDTLKELKADIKKDLEDKKAQQVEADFEQAIAEELAKLVKGEIPECMYERATDEAVQNFAYQIQQAGMDPDMYLQYTGTTIDDLKKQFRERSETQVKCQLALDKIAELEKVEVSDEDIKARYEEMAKMYEVELSVVENAFPAEDMKKDMRGAKALDIVKAAAKADAKPAAKKADAEEKKPAAKKAPAKKADDAEKKPAAKKAPAKKAPAKKADK
ncbi:MAG: trigger factor [Oscillospiraceae bacterium]|nr:trigger factor [Candidatus Limimonas egerieequi]